MFEDDVEANHPGRKRRRPSKGFDFLDVFQPTQQPENKKPRLFSRSASSINQPLYPISQVPSSQRIDSSFFAAAVQPKSYPARAASAESSRKPSAGLVSVNDFLLNILHSAQKKPKARRSSRLASSKPKPKVSTLKLTTSDPAHDDGDYESEPEAAPDLEPPNPKPKPLSSSGKRMPRSSTLSAEAPAEPPVLRRSLWPDPHASKRSKKKQGNSGGSGTVKLLKGKTSMILPELSLVSRKEHEAGFARMKNLFTGRIVEQSDLFPQTRNVRFSDHIETIPQLSTSSSATRAGAEKELETSKHPSSSSMPPAQDAVDDSDDYWTSDEETPAPRALKAGGLSPPIATLTD